MADKLSFKDFMVVDYRPGEPLEIKYQDHRQRRVGGSSVSEKKKKQKHTDPLSTGKHAPNVGMGWTGKHTTIKDPTSSRHTHVFQYTEQTELDEVSQDDEQTVHKMLNSMSAEKLLKAYKKLYRKEYPGTSKSELVSKIKSKVRNYKQAYELMKEEAQLDEVSQELASKVAKARQAQASNLRQKAVDEPDMMKAFAHTKAANKAEKKAGQSYNRLMKKEETEEVEEALTMPQRLARSRQAKRLKAKMQLGRKRAAKRIASQEKLMLRARRKARDFILKRLTKDIPKSELTFARRQELEKRLDKMKGRIDKIAKRLLPKVRQAELAKKRK